MQNQLRLLRDVSALILIAATWRLWFAASDFPAVPFLSSLTSVPRTIDQVLSGVLVAVLLVDAGLAIGRLIRQTTAQIYFRFEQGCDLVFALSAVSLILLNQHCLQPWVYHFLLLTPLLWKHDFSLQRNVEAAEDDETPTSGRFIDGNTTRAIVYLTASIYVWSAWSKLDASFLQSHGPKFVAAICDAAGISTHFWTDRTWQIAAAMLPVGELIVGIALLIVRTRRPALVASMLMHLLLIVAVGPWGLNHREGVLLWNGFFVAQNVILLLSGSQSNGTAREFTRWKTRRVALLVSVVAILFPAFRSVGYCDTWPAWAVYASSPARVLVQVRDSSIDQLQNSLQSYVEPRQLNDGWSWLRIDLWSLDATGTPIYPEDRFQLGVARAVLQAAGLRDNVRVIHEEEADRWTATRGRTESIGNTEVAEMGLRFSLNSMPCSR